VLRRLIRLVARFPWLVSPTFRVSESLEVVRCGDFLLPLPSTPEPSTSERLDPVARVERLVSWVRSDDLTWGEAEALLVLDETTQWAPGRR
jgi:hypothetical protein